jgi:hypothetical protein
MIYRLIVPMTMAILAVQGGQALAQGSFPAPLPNQSASSAQSAPTQQGVIPNDSAFPPVNGAAPKASISAPSAASPFPSSGAAPLAIPGGFSAPPPAQAGAPPDACTKAFLPLRDDAAKKGKLIEAAGKRKAPPEEACKLIASYAAAELKMLRYVEANTAKCGIPPQVAEQLKAGHKNTETMQTKVCAVAEQAKTRGPAGPSLSEVLGSSSAMPEATPASRKGGSAFDTLTGNVLQR